ncbi:MAG: hypothetical protein J1F42_01710 [Lachnospiraceae bacterium]|nr:hypothetical protein [Lachnospiraceae bacterium]
MSDQEIVEMVVVMVLMSRTDFKEVVDYIARTEMQPGERDFMELAVEIAANKRQKNGTNTK